MADLPTPLPTGHLTSQIHQLRKKVERLQPRRAPGTLTSVGPRGTTRSAVSTGAQNTGKKVAARWA